MSLPRALKAAPAAALVLVALAGCQQKAPAAGAGGRAVTVTVTATDTDCSLSATSVPSGTTIFTVKNTGTKVTEFYVRSGDRLMGEVEDIAPGLTRTLSLPLKAGSYTTLCKPGESGSGVGRTTLRVDR